MQIVQILLDNFLSVILAALATALGLYLKQKLGIWADNKTKREIVAQSVRYAEQIGRELTSSEKYAEAMRAASEQLSQLGISYTDLELRVLIESTVNEFFSAVKGEEVTNESVD